MNTQQDFCPGCGAEVYPEERQCPFCGRSLRSGVLVPVLVGVGGTAVALLAGALVWWVLASPAPGTSSAGTSPPGNSPQVAARAPESAAAPAEVPVIRAPQANPPAASTAPQVETPPAAAPAPATPPAVAAPPAAAPMAPQSAPEAAPLSTPRTASSLLDGAQGTLSHGEVSAFAPAPTAGALLDDAARVSTVPAAPPGSVGDGATGDPETRRAFAKTKQDSFAQNGLDLQVSTTGADDRVLVIKFNFSAKTAAELIVAGPFPKQCEQRGFKEILFQDPTGASWVYDIATQKMSVR